MVYFTASGIQSFEPTIVWEDKDVIAFTFATLPNPNIGDSKKQIELINQLSSVDPKLQALSNAMKSHVNAQESIKKTNSKK